MLYLRDEVFLSIVHYLGKINDTLRVFVQYYITTFKFDSVKNTTTFTSIIRNERNSGSDEHNQLNTFFIMVEEVHPEADYILHCVYNAQSY